MSENDDNSPISHSQSQSVKIQDGFTNSSERQNIEEAKTRYNHSDMKSISIGFSFSDDEIDESHVSESSNIPRFVEIKSMDIEAYDPLSYHNRGQPPISIDVANMNYFPSSHLSPNGVDELISPQYGNLQERSQLKQSVLTHPKSLSDKLTSLCVDLSAMALKYNISYDVLKQVECQISHSICNEYYTNNAYSSTFSPTMNTATSTSTSTSTQLHVHVPHPKGMVNFGIHSINSHTPRLNLPLYNTVSIDHHSNPNTARQVYTYYQHQHQQHPYYSRSHPPPPKPTSSSSSSQLGSTPRLNTTPRLLHPHSSARTSSQQQQQQQQRQHEYISVPIIQAPPTTSSDTQLNDRGDDVSTDDICATINPSEKRVKLNSATSSL